MKYYSLIVCEPLEIDTSPQISENLPLYVPPIICSEKVVAWMWSPTDGNLSCLCQGLNAFWFQRHLNSKILKHDFQLPTIMGVQSNISLSSYLVVVACITSFWLVLVHFESANFSAAEIFKYLFFTALKIHFMARIGKETIQLYFQFISYIKFFCVSPLLSDIE